MFALARKNSKERNGLGLTDICGISRGTKIKTNDASPSAQKVRSCLIFAHAHFFCFAAAGLMRTRTPPFLPPKKEKHECTAQKAKTKYMFWETVEISLGGKEAMTEPFRFVGK